MYREGAREKGNGNGDRGISGGDVFVGRSIDRPVPSVAREIDLAPLDRAAANGSPRKIVAPLDYMDPFYGNGRVYALTVAGRFRTGGKYANPS